jgi:hypothetical protein
MKELEESINKMRKWFMKWHNVEIDIAHWK